MNESAPLPPMVEATLGPDEIRLLFDELGTYARVIGVRAKAGPRSHASEEELTLAEACERFLSGEMRAIQVQYQHDGSVWSDTLMRGAGGVRLVRCRHEGSISG